MTRSNTRRDTASLSIKASPQALFDAFVDPQALAQWLPPDGANGRFDLFEPSEGGRFRFILTFDTAEGKTSDNTDVVRGRFVKIAPHEKIVQEVEFDSNDPRFAGTMTMTWTFVAGPEGSIATVTAEGVPSGIDHAEHETALASTLRNLSRFVER